MITDIVCKDVQVEINQIEPHGIKIHNLSSGNVQMYLSSEFQVVLYIEQQEPNAPRKDTIFTDTSFSIHNVEIKTLICKNSNICISPSVFSQRGVNIQLRNSSTLLMEEENKQPHPIEIIDLFIENNSVMNAKKQFCVTECFVDANESEVLGLIAMKKLVRYLVKSHLTVELVSGCLISGPSFEETSQLNSQICFGLFIDTWEIQNKLCPFKLTLNQILLSPDGKKLTTPHEKTIYYKEKDEDQFDAVLLIAPMNQEDWLQAYEATEDKIITYVVTNTHQDIKKETKELFEKIICCKLCQSENRQSSEWCRDCKFRLYKRCSVCQTRMDGLYCAQCGTKRQLDMIYYDEFCYFPSSLFLLQINEELKPFHAKVAKDEEDACYRLYVNDVPFTFRKAQNWLLEQTKK